MTLNYTLIHVLHIKSSHPNFFIHHSLITQDTSTMNDGLLQMNFLFLTLSTMDLQTLKTGEGNDLI